MSGMTAALEIAEAGYEAVLVEKTGALGGMTAQLWKRQPFKEPYAEAQDTGVAEMAAKVTANPKIKLHLNSTIAETSGAPGRFAIKVAQESGAVTEEIVGAIVQATGFTTYDMAKLPELGGGQANVVDQAGLEALAMSAKGGAIKRADGKEVKIASSSSSAPASATIPARICPTARATAAAPASSRRLFQGPESRHRHRDHVSGPARAGHGRGLLPQRPGKGRDLHQGQGQPGQPAATAARSASRT